MSEKMELSRCRGTIDPRQGITGTVEICSRHARINVPLSRVWQLLRITVVDQFVRTVIVTAMNANRRGPRERTGKGIHRAN
jgi:hypothetical protein